MTTPEDSLPAGRSHPGPCPGAGCRCCWLAAHDGRYQRLWGLPVTAPEYGARRRPPAAPASRGICAHRGEPTGEQVECAPCGPRVRLKVFACAVHGRCHPDRHAAGVIGCATCSDWERSESPPAPDTRPAHSLCSRFQAALRQGAPALSGRGRGVVTCAGGGTFFAGAWCQISVLRWLGSALPVEVWHLGPGEMDPVMHGLLESLGNVRVVDALAVAAALPVPPRILNGWELKPFSVIHAAFAEVLFLDADCYPARDPAFLFDHPAYRAHGALFWPDLPPAGRREWLPAVCWTNLGLAYRDEPDFESGQFLVDRARCADALAATMWLNEHSDEVYQFVYGDKSTFHLAWRAVGRDYALAPPCRWKRPAILQHAPGGAIQFVHACQGKDSLARARLLRGLPLASEVQNAGRVLASRWRGRVWDHADQSPSESRLAAGIPGGYHYDREGIGSRPLELLPAGTIGIGAAACEWRWSLRLREGKPTLVLVGAGNKGTEIGMMFLTQDGQGVWRGRWTAHERGPVSLTPLVPREPPPGWQLREGTWDRGIFDCVVRDNEYGLPPGLPAGATVIDLGAHTGSFALACLTRGAARVMAFEPQVDNVRLLRANLAPFGTRADVRRAACWPGGGFVEVYHPAPGHPNTGGFAVRLGASVPALDLDDLLGGVGPVWLVKLDVVGAEGAILSTCRRLGEVGRVVGEYHAGQDGVVTSSLVAAGFAVTTAPTGDGIGFFNAERK